MKLTSVMQRFVLHWGEMGTRWGVNRSVAQIHALLYLVAEPLPADEIAETLDIARSNVSTSLKELQNWNLVTLTSVLGDRRDHFIAHKDMWDMVVTVMDGRKKREIDPTIHVLKDCVSQANAEDQTPVAVKERIENMLSFTEEVAGWYDDIKRLKRGTLIKLLKMGARIGKLVGD